MADPYSSPAAPPPTLPPSANPAATVQIARPSASQPDFLFPESDYDQTFRRSWGERLTYHAGTAYLIGTPRCRLRLSAPPQLHLIG